MSALLTQSPGDTVQTETGKVDPARKFKCTTAARVAMPDALPLKITHFLDRTNQMPTVKYSACNGDKSMLANSHRLIYEYH